MNFLLYLFFFCTAVISFYTTFLPPDEIAEKVLSNYIETIGGSDIITKVESRIYELTAKKKGIDIRIIVIQKKPDKFYQKVIIDKSAFELIFNGENGFKIVSGRYQKLESAELDKIKFQSILYPQNEYPKDFYNPEFIAYDSTRNLSAILRMYKTDYIEIIHHYDLRSGFLIKQEVLEGGNHSKNKIDYYYAEYIESQGIKFPNYLTYVFNNDTVIFKTIMHKINDNISDSIFEIN